MAKRLSIIISLVVLLASCEREFTSRPSAHDLCFSADTLNFGTVLPDKGTPTDHVTLQNTGGEDVTIESIVLAGGTASPFNININGVPSTELADVRLRHSDSLYIFVSLKPTEALRDRAITTIEDEVVVRSDKNRWHLTLTANVMNVVRASGVLDGQTMWAQDSMAYYVTDTLTVAEGATLTIGEGARVLMAPGATISVRGAMRTNGTVEKPITFRGTRQDEFYDDIPGQWNGIRIEAGAKADFRHTTLGCCDRCLVADSASRLTADALTVRDGAHDGIAIRKTEGVVANSLIANCGGGVSLESGSLTMTHTTVSMYYKWDFRRRPALNVTAADTTAPCRLKVENSIIMGNLANEVEVDSVRKAAPDAIFSHSLIRTAKTKEVEADTVTFVNCKVAKDAHFADRTEMDFHLTEESDAVGTADIDVSRRFPLDMEGAPRGQNETSQMGAYETVAEKK